MRLASQSARIHAAGGEVIAISVDPEERQAAMFQRWPTPSTTYVSDPGGETYLQAMNMFDPNERGGIALPGLFVLDPAGKLVYEYRGHDFADRRDDEEAFAALEGLGLDAIDPVAGGPVDESVDLDQKGAFTPRILVPYFKGNRFGALAIQMRAEGEEAKRLATEHREMADAILAAWDQVKPS